MNRYTLQQLAEACFNLRQRKEGFPLCAVEWLHFTNARDKTQKAILLCKPAPSFFEALLRIPWLMLRSLGFSFLIFFARLSLRRQIKELEAGSFDLAAKTWSPSAKLGGDDFYFGDIQKRIGIERQRILLLCGNVTRKNWRIFLRQFHGKNTGNKIPDICYLTATDVFRIFFLQCLAFFRLHRWSRLESDPLKQNVLLWARSHVLRFQTMMNGLNFFLAARVVKKFQPKAYVTLYEGHAWEECSWRGVKGTGLSCKTVGYQHTVIMARALDLLKPLQDGSALPLPDIVLCSGPRSLEMMNREKGDGRIRYLVFGSFRASDNKTALKPNCPRPCTVLVTPEGILEEATLLFNAAIEVAQGMKKCHFIFRSHPILPMEMIVPTLKADPNSLKNIEISNHDLDYDLNRSSALLYRGTSVVLYAVLKGLKPIYYHTEEDVIDPLYELSGWKVSVATVEELQKVLSDLSREFVQESQTAWEESLHYVQDYVMPVGERSVKQFLEVLH